MSSNDSAMRREGFTIVALVIGLLTGCSIAKTDSSIAGHGAVKVNGGGFSSSEVLPDDRIERKYFNEYSLPLWNPTTNDVIVALNALPEFLGEVANAPLGERLYPNELPGVQERMPNTVCQIVGITLNGQRALLLNCLPHAHQSRRGWNEEFITVFDGGPRWWSVVYVPESSKFTRLILDLGY